MDVELYCTQSGKEVVQEFLDSLPHKGLAKVIRDIELLAQYAPDLHEPYKTYRWADLGAALKIFQQYLSYLLFHLGWE